MGIVDEDIVRVREATDIVAVITQYTQLKRVGRRFVGLCPFHSEKTPSFSVNSEEGLYYCFGCSARGDAISFLREKEQLDFVGAVERLAQKAGIALRFTDAGQGEDRKRRQRLVAATQAAVDWYHERLLTSSDAGPARSYLRQRGYDRSIVEQYQMGWAPDGWDVLCRQIKLNEEDLVASGLGFINRRGRPQDAFRNRIVFPIFDAQENAVGFGGRKMPDGDGPKYKNSAESEIYNKSQILYGLNWAKTEIVKVNHVVVCEGYTDVIGFGQAGLSGAVATCGTALTENHVRLLRRFGRRVILAFDADSAGQNAAARFYEWEKSHDLDVYVADMPAGVDPGELAQSDPERLRASIDDATPFLEFLVSRALEAGDLTTAEGRVKAADRCFELIGEHPEPLVRDQYVLTVASRCRLEEALARRQLETVMSRPKANPEDSGSKTPGQHGHPDPNRRLRSSNQRTSPEFEALKLVLQPDDTLSELVTPELFADELCALTYELVSSTDSLHIAISEGGPEVGELLQRLSVEETDAEAIDVAGRLWERYLGRQIEHCRIEARSADADRYSELNQEMNWLKYRLEELRDEKARASAVETLLGWLRQEPEEMG